MAAKPPPARVAPDVGEELDDAPVTFEDEAEIEGALVTGDHGAVDVVQVRVVGTRIDRAVLTAARFERSDFVDCIVVNADLAGVSFDECRLTRVELHGCRLSGAQLAASKLTDVAFVDCRLDGANFRMTELTRVELARCDLHDADFYAAKAPGVRFADCDLRDVELAKADLTGASLVGSVVDGIRGADRLAGTTIGGDQIVPVALAVFDALRITVRDDE